MTSFFGIFFGHPANHAEDRIHPPLSPHKGDLKWGTFSCFSSLGRLSLIEDTIPTLCVRGRKSLHRCPKLPLEEHSGELHLPKQDLKFLSANMGKEKLQHGASDEENQSHRFGCMEVMGIDVLCMHQGVEGLESIVLYVPPPMRQLPHLPCCKLLQAGEDPKLYLLATAKALFLHPGYLDRGFNSLQEEASKGIDPIGDHPLGICPLDIFNVMGIGTVVPKKPHGITMSRPAS